LTRSFPLPLLALAMVVTACTGEGVPTEPEPSNGEAAPADDCERTQSGTDPVDNGSLSGDLIQLSRETFGCVGQVVVATEADTAGIAAGAQLAAAVRGPLLLPDAGLAAELDRLAPSDVYVMAGADAAVPEGAEAHQLTPAEAVALTAETLDTANEVALPAEPGASTVVDTVAAIHAADRVVTPANDAEPTDPPEAADDTDAAGLADVIAGLPPPRDGDTVWLVDADDPFSVLAMTPIATAARAAAVPVDGSDLFRYPELGGPLAGRAEQPVRLIGEFQADTDWQLSVITNGYELPGGGYEPFPDDVRRTFIAFYGHPDSSAMGALGQQDGPESTLERMQPLLDDFAEHSDIVVPTFNVIATVAHNGGSTGQPDQIVDFDSPRYVEFSTMHPPSRFEEWADAADQADGYFMMDFQPGRNDFLYQVRHYEDLVRRPHVGVALDPEWRLGSNQQHLQQIGSVTADEINTVIDWLADVVREEGLPPKVLLLHQFRLSMIHDRDEIVDRPEVAVVIQMDGEGQGSLALKDETWRAITAGAEDSHWHWGWKNFFERDTPSPNSPTDTMSKEPTPVYVSYQ
jgi:hypothetical protein